MAKKSQKPKSYVDKQIAKQKNKESYAKKKEHEKEVGRKMDEWEK